MNNFTYFAPLILVILSNVFYHIMSKNISSDLNPFLGLSVTYSVALFISLLIFTMTHKIPLTEELKPLNVSNFILGISVLGLEGGYLLMYRNGWQISRGALTASICVAILLFIIGIFFYKESITIKKTAGVFFCIAGVLLISTK